MKTYKIPSDVELKDIQKVPSMQNNEGVALVTTGDAGDVSEAELLKALDGKAVLFNSSRSIFIFDCSHRLWKDKTYKRNIAAGMELTKGVEKILDDSIEKYVDGTFVPEPDPVPEPEPVVEPEPSDFEVESWVPQDESTEEDDV